MVITFNESPMGTIRLTHKVSHHIGKWHTIFKRSIKYSSFLEKKPDDFQNNLKL